MRESLKIAGSSALIAATVVTLTIVGGQPAGAVAPSKSGWFDQTAPAPAPAAPSPLATGKQLQVSEGPTGPTSFAAVSYTVDPSTSGATLMLQVAPTGPAATPPVTAPGGASAPTPTPTVNACPITNPGWPDGEDQPSSAAPSYDCSQAVVGTPSSDGTSETWSLSAPQNGTYDVALVPAAGSTPFTIVYQPPDANSLTPQAASAPLPGGGGLPSGSSSGSPGLSGSTGGSGVSAGGSSLPTGGSPPSDVVGSGAAQPIVPTTPSGSGGSSALGATPTRSAQTPTRSGPLTGAATPLATSLLSSKAERVTAFVLLLILVVGLIGLAARPTRAPRLLGSLGSANFRTGGSHPPGEPPGAPGR